MWTRIPSTKWFLLTRYSINLSKLSAYSVHLIFCWFYTFDDYFHLVCKYTTIFHKGDNSTIHVTIPYNVQQSTQTPPAIKGQVFVSVQKVTWLYQADASMVNFMLDWFKQFSFQKAQWNSTMNNVNCCFDLDL